MQSCRGRAHWFSFGSLRVVDLKKSSSKPLCNEVSFFFTELLYFQIVFASVFSHASRKQSSTPQPAGPALWLALCAEFSRAKAAIQRTRDCHGAPWKKRIAPPIGQSRAGLSTGSVSLGSFSVPARLRGCAAFCARFESAVLRARQAPLPHLSVARRTICSSCVQSL